MSQSPTIEDRIGTLEKEVSMLKRLYHRHNGDRNWVDDVSGSMKDFPEFDEVVALGREFRESQSDSSD